MVVRGVGVWLKKQQIWVITAILGVAILSFGIVAYLEATTPKFEVGPPKGVSITPTLVRISVVVRNTGYVPGSAVMVFELTFLSNSTTFSESLDIRLDVGGEQICEVNIDLPPGYATEGGVVRCYLTEIERWNMS